jgi:hypothetical protein
VQATIVTEISRVIRELAGDCDHFFFFILCPSVDVQAFYPMGETLPPAARAVEVNS